MHQGDVQERSTSHNLTARGAATRARIVSTAADLIRVRGIGRTTLDDVVAASKVSKSQFYRHFEDKPALVRAVIDLVGDRIIARERGYLENVKSFAGLRRWRDALVERNDAQKGQYGCSLGSLANEFADQDAVAREKLDELFAAWEALFENIVHRLQEQGAITQDADAARLATGFMAALQGGYLLAQTSRDVAPMAAAVDMAIDHLRLLGRDAH